MDENIVFKDKIVKIIVSMLAVIGIILGLREVGYATQMVEQVYNQQYITENAIDMEMISNDTYQTTSIDCQIPIVQENIKQIALDLEVLGENILSGAIYYGDYQKWVSVGFKDGSNIITLPQVTDRIRIDLTDKEGVQVKVNSILVNPIDATDAMNYKAISICVISLIVLIVSLFFYESVKKLIIRHKMQTLVIILLSTLLVYTLNESAKHNVGGLRSNIVIIGIVISVFIIGVIGVRKIEETKLLKLFVFFASLFGLIFAVLLPPMQGPDEDVHWIRSYHLAKGNIGYSSSIEGIPESIQNYLTAIGAHTIPFNYEKKIEKDEFFTAMKMPLNKESVESHNDGGRTKTYLTYAYLPQSIGMAMGNISGLSPYWILLLGRISNLIVWIIICSIALAIMPIRKELFFMLLLLPMNIHQAANLSPDVMLNASCYMLTAYIFYLKFQKEKVGLKDIGILMLCGVGIVGVKFPYLMLMLLLGLVPMDKFKVREQSSAMEKVSFKVMSVILCIIVPLIFFVLNQRLLVNYDPVVADSQVFGTVDVIKDVLMNLGIYFKIMLTTLVSNADFYMQGMIGRFGWLDASMPDFTIFYSIVIMGILASIPAKEEYNITYVDRGIMLIIVIGFLQMLVLAMIQWNGAGWTEMREVGGIQGRYFLPFFLLIPLTLSNKLITYKRRIIATLSMRRIVYLSVCFIYTIAICTLMYRYWI